ncbi:unnamed protein product [Paramecium sonneborni]|uniref:Uncharacterized protein n=1 Tax=Paramecium sonneborni TaxID=65129 RepID=A0A8S1Q3K7_9CILI|nr:unnamed protein product [Paramecium sonneborni]
MLPQLQRLFNNGAGCNSKIKMLEFKQGMFKYVKILSVKRQDHFKSGSEDKSIIIWISNQNNKWISQEKLNGIYLKSIFYY